MGKITKDLSKLSKVPHPQSRKTAQLTKKIIKQDHRNKTKHGHLIRANLQGEKFMWFKSELKHYPVCSPEGLLAAAEKYLSRFDEELEMIKIKHGIGGRRNRQHANREDIIKINKKNEEEEFNTCGIELPDVFNAKQFTMFKEWNGELRFIQNFKLCRFSRNKLKGLIEAHKETALGEMEVSSSDNKSTVSIETDSVQKKSPTME